MCNTVFLYMFSDFELTSGEMYIEVQYNGKDLYSNHWELCTVEEGMEDRIIFCPIPVGKKNFVKDLPIPSYLPKVNQYCILIDGKYFLID